MLDKTIADSFPASDPPSTDPAPLADSFAALGKPYRNETTMDILSLAAIQLQCFECGGSYLVPLRDVLLSHKILHDGCPVAAETECPPYFSRDSRRNGRLTPSMRHGATWNVVPTPMAANWY
jgi:hypothetical protein